MLGCALALVTATLGSLAGGAQALPDARGYELVSTADKNGADVIGDPGRVRVADDGRAVGYSSLTEFNDSIGGGIATEYLAVRSPQAGGQGWVTHAIMPRQPALTFGAAANGFEPRYQEDFSPDLQRGVLFAWRPVTNDPLVANVANLYWRDDLLTAGGGDYRLVTSCAVCLGPLSVDQLRLKPIMLASTPDLSRVLFESALNLAPGAVGSGTKLYEWDAASGHPVLAGVLPNGSGAFDSAAGIGHGDYEHRHAISTDGRKVFFIATAAGVQNVYMRLDETSTIQLNLPEGGGPSTAAAHYGDATPDGSRIFFTTAQQLTPDAPFGGGLYRYDTTLPPSNPDHLIYIAPASKVLGASADGQTVYFTANGPLLPGQPPPPYVTTLYAWHAGDLAFVADISPGDVVNLTETSVGGETSRVSPSGNVMFLTAVPTATNPVGRCPQTATRACDMLYVYTPGSGARPVCVSCHPDGSAPTASVDSLYSISEGGAFGGDHLNRPLTDDGHRVFFTTADALLPEDVNGKRDVYEYDLTTGALSLISSGRSSADSYFMESNPDGSDALFVTREQLVGWDTDPNYDLYDARIGGGFPEPVPAAPGCSGQDCRPAPSSPPALAPTSSEDAHTTGNLHEHFKPRTKPCRHGFARKHVHGRTKCVKIKARRRSRTARAPGHPKRGR